MSRWLSSGEVSLGLQLHTAREHTWSSDVVILLCRAHRLPVQRAHGNDTSNGQRLDLSKLMHKAWVTYMVGDIGTERNRLRCEKMLNPVGNCTMVFERDVLYKMAAMVRGRTVVYWLREGRTYIYFHIIRSHIINASGDLILGEANLSVLDPGEMPSSGT